MRWRGRLDTPRSRSSGVGGRVGRGNAPPQPPACPRPAPPGPARPAPRRRQRPPFRNGFVTILAPVGAPQAPRRGVAGRPAPPLAAPGSPGGRQGPCRGRYGGPPYGAAGGRPLARGRGARGRKGCAPSRGGVAWGCEPGRPGGEKRTRAHSLGTQAAETARIAEAPEAKRLAPAENPEKEAGRPTGGRSGNKMRKAPREADTRAHEAAPKTRAALYAPSKSRRIDGEGEAPEREAESCERREAGRPKRRTGTSTKSRTENPTPTRPPLGKRTKEPPGVGLGLEPTQKT